ncbi:transporter substrate-binding domain-containing protein [Roseomonas marmotae]|uniref:Transporter substrate-binding domain-containing protein n=1 Tax=Roseomonas marmotae TaxID=2768161 RepID=A0ABS3K7A2_9PROT|nr:transporter substrate-binding domain-containing protein [Roseomonas marmotae]MBO1073339.1 transporter substrate-binding domain-containing protein [Roseomonas marmotae]QTI79047.1 transporter substrate-binding domain-containing protein [Roseomonas marmotae]
MTASPHRAFRARLGAALLGLGLLLAHPLAPRAAELNAEARAALPEATRNAGVLKVATSLQWPPFAFKAEAGGPDGIDIRLMQLLAGKLGLKAEFEDIKFPTIIPGVVNGRYNVGINQIGRTAERLRVVNLLPYFNSGYGLLVRQGTTDVDVNNLCGRTLVLTQGSAQIQVAEQLSADCVAAGKEKIAFLFFPNSADTYLALSNGRGDGFLTAKAVGIYIAKGNPKLQMTESTLPDRSTLSGIVIAKNNAALEKAIQMALESAVQDGSYVRLLEEFGVPDGAVTVEQIRNPPPA